MSWRINRGHLKLARRIVEIHLLYTWLEVSSFSARCCNQYKRMAVTQHVSWSILFLIRGESGTKLQWTIHSYYPVVQNSHVTKMLLPANLLSVAHKTSKLLSAVLSLIICFILLTPRRVLWFLNGDETCCPKDGLPACMSNQSMYTGVASMYV